jgi:hypothetical protein
VISDFGEEDAAFAEISERLSGSHRLSAVIIEDAIFSRPLPPGHYPLRAPGDSDRRSVTLNHTFLNRGVIAGFR